MTMTLKEWSEALRAVPGHKCGIIDADEGRELADAIDSHLAMDGAKVVPNADARAYTDECVNALDHIRRVASSSRISSKRLTWIASRADSAINGDEKWRTAPVPKNGQSLLMRAQDRIRELEATLSTHPATGEKVPHDDEV